MTPSQRRFLLVTRPDQEILSEEVAESLGTAFARDSEGQFGPVYDQLDEEGVQELRGAGYRVVEIGEAEVRNLRRPEGSIEGLSAALRDDLDRGFRALREKPGAEPDASWSRVAMRPEPAPIPVPGPDHLCPPRQRRRRERARMRVGGAP